VSVAARHAYVPANRLAAKPAGGRAAPLPRDLALRPARIAFRRVAWTGVAPEPERVVAPPTAVQRLDLRTGARRFFAEIPWAGPRVTFKPTAVQSATSVASILGTFNWGDES
jgi:hypothetical protein